MSNILSDINRQQLEKRLSKLRVPVLILFVILVLLIPVLTQSNRYLTLVLSLIGIYVIAVTGLNIVYGYSGQVNFGQAAFYGIGAYAVAILSGLHGWSFWTSAAIGVVAAGVLAFIIGWPSVKLVHHFLALVTIGFCLSVGSP